MSPFDAREHVDRPDGREMEILEAFLRRLPGSARVLDAGCGQGDPVLRRLTDAATAVGVDVSREQLRLAAGNAPAASLVRGDITNLPFGDGVFGAVTAFHSLIHVPADEHQRVLEEWTTGDGLDDDGGRWRFFAARLDPQYS